MVDLFVNCKKQMLSKCFTSNYRIEFVGFSCYEPLLTSPQLCHKIMFEVGRDSFNTHVNLIRISLHLFVKFIMILAITNFYYR